MKKIPAVLFRLLHWWEAPARIGATYTLPAPVQLPPSSLADDEALPEIPRTIWTYWNQPRLEPFVQQCVDSWRRHCPDHTVTVVTPDRVGQYVALADLPPGFAQLHPTQQSDWLRLYLVSRHGGCWLDATLVLTTSLDWMTSHGGARSSELTGFYLEGFTKDARYPVIENWAFRAPAGSRFVSEWHEEYHQALIVEGPAAYLERLRTQPEGADILRCIPDPHYLLCHVAAQRVMRRIPDARLTLFKAEDTAYFYHAALRWHWYLLYPHLCLAAAPATVAPLIKLRGGERQHFSEMLAQHGGAAPGSILSRVFAAP